jgi:hypothetical protein
MKAFRKRVRVQSYVEPELARRIVDRVETTGATESGMVRSSLLQYLDGQSDATLVLRRLDRLGRALTRLHRDMEFHSEAFSVFVHSWFAHTPPVPEDRRKTALTLAEARYQQYMDDVVRRFAGGRRFLDDLPQESVANDTELDAILVKADERGPR